MSGHAHRQAISRRALVITNAVLILLPLVVVGLLVQVGAQPASRFRSILLVVFAVEAVIFLLPSSWLPTGGVRAPGTLITAREFRTFMQETRAMARDRPWGSEKVAIGPALAFVLVALSFLVAR
jgi:hypothetical protein